MEMPVASISFASPIHSELRHRRVKHSALLQMQMKRIVEAAWRTKFRIAAIASQTVYAVLFRCLPMCVSPRCLANSTCFCRSSAAARFSGVRLA